MYLHVFISDFCIVYRIDNQEWGQSIIDQYISRFFYCFEEKKVIPHRYLCHEARDEKEAETLRRILEMVQNDRSLYDTFETMLRIGMNVGEKLPA